MLSSSALRLMWSWVDAVMRIFSGPGAGTGGAGSLTESEISDARGLWLAWLEMPYPRDYPAGSTDAIVDGVDLARLDAELSPIFRDHFDGGLADDGRLRLEAEMRLLERVVPMLRGDGRPYFAAARSVGRWILRGSPG